MAHSGSYVDSIHACVHAVRESHLEIRWPSDVNIDYKSRGLFDESDCDDWGGHCGLSWHGFQNLRDICC